MVGADDSPVEVVASGNLIMHNGVLWPCPGVVVPPIRSWAPCREMTV